MLDRMKDISRRKVLIGSAAVPALLAASPMSAFAAGAEGRKYTFFHILWSMTDPNVQFHIKAGQAYMKEHSDVEIKYVGPDHYDPAEHEKFLETVINDKPDGIAMHISSVDALLPGMRAAHKAGIPFVSITSHPADKADNEKIAGLYLAWVGADESKIGAAMGERLLKEGTPKRVAYLMAHLGHTGQEERAAGFFASMPKGVATDKVAIGDEPQKAKDIIRSYIASHGDVGALFGSALMNKWVTDVLDELGRSNVQFMTADAAPSSLDCILQKKCLATFSQQFPIQAPFGYDVLYYYIKTRMYPTAPIVTGPRVVDASNAATFKKAVIDAIGAKEYAKLSPY